MTSLKRTESVDAEDSGKPAKKAKNPDVVEDEDETLAELPQGSAVEPQLPISPKAVENMDLADSAVGINANDNDNEKDISKTKLEDDPIVEA